MTNTVFSWGRYPLIPQQVYPVYWPNELPQVLSKVLDQQSLFDKECGRSTLAFGMGRSYGDSCLAASNHVITMSGMDRVLSADWETGIITAQAGLTLDALIQFALPRGWFLPVTPGSRFVTLGGAVANDVHGKNHHVNGTFGLHVRQLILYRSDEGVVVCSSDTRSELFAATIGGLGLTGIIIAIEMQLRRVSSNQIVQKSIKFSGLDEFFQLSSQHNSDYEYSVAWIDCLATGKHTGRGRYIVGNHANEGDLSPMKASRITVPFNPPVSLINTMTLKAFNGIYYHRQRPKEVHSHVRLEQFFYPLDSVLHWNRMYGKGGFQQYQCVVPRQHSREVIKAVLIEIAKSGTGSFLAVLKQFGNIDSPGLLSFPMPGATLALDFPQNEPKISSLFDKLDALVHEAGGRLYPAKDAHMSASNFRQAYPAWERVESLRDPYLLSRFWRRVTQ